MLNDSYDWSDLGPNQFNGQEFTPKGTMRLPYKPLHERLGNGVYEVPSLIVDIYVEDEVRRDDSGAQADFFRNGADTECDDEFGIKTFNTFYEAYCAYNRQYMAAAEDMAPPVGRMVLFSRVSKGNRIRISQIAMGENVQRKYLWGYQTSLALMDSEDGDNSEDRYENAVEAFDEHIEERRCEIDIPSCFDQDVDIDYCEDYKQNFVDDHMAEHCFSNDKDYKSQIEGHEWAFKYDELWSEAELKYAISEEDAEINNRGRTWTIARHKTHVSKDWNPMWGLALINRMKENPYSGIHSANQHINDEPVGDLHNMNVGSWNGDACVIDWGYHIMGGGQNCPTSFDCDPVPNMDWQFSQREGNVTPLAVA